VLGVSLSLSALRHENAASVLLCFLRSVRVCERSVSLGMTIDEESSANWRGWTHNQPPGESPAPDERAQERTKGTWVHPTPRDAQPRVL
jgi:hypothetical protein